MKQYLSQRAAPGGVIFEYALENHVVESIYLTRDEILEKGPSVSPELGEAIKWTLEGLVMPKTFPIP